MHLLIAADRLNREHSIVAFGAGFLFHHFDRRGGHFGGFTSHDLSDEGVILRPAGDIVVKVSEVGLIKAAAAGEEGAIKERLGHAHGAAVPPRDDSHCGIGVPGKPGLEEGSIEAGNGGGDAGVDPAAATEVGGGATRINIFRAGGDGGAGGGGVVRLARHLKDGKRVVGWQLSVSEKQCGGVVGSRVFPGVVIRQMRLDSLNGKGRGGFLCRLNQHGACVEIVCISWGYGTEVGC